MLCKNSKNENRIVKLGVDGKIVTTIDEEYFMNCKKERANSAIVLDIQLPDLDNEISVVQGKAFPSRTFDFAKSCPKRN